MSDSQFTDVELSGWKQIADALRCSEDSAQRSATRSYDPLPVWYDPWGTPTLWRSAAVAWKARNTLPAQAYQACVCQENVP